MDRSTRIAAFVPNILDRSRFPRSADVDLVFVDGPDQVTGPAVSETPDVVVVDLDRCADPAAFVAERSVDPSRSGADASPRASGSAPVPTVVGFGSHVDDERLQQARDAGFDEVLARSVFFRRLPTIVGGRP